MDIVAHVIPRNYVLRSPLIALIDIVCLVAWVSLCSCGYNSWLLIYTESLELKL